MAKRKIKIIFYRMSVSRSSFVANFFGFCLLFCFVCFFCVSFFLFEFFYWGFWTDSSRVGGRSPSPGCRDWWRWRRYKCLRGCHLSRRDSSPWSHLPFEIPGKCCTRSSSSIGGVKAQSYLSANVRLMPRLVALCKPVAHTHTQPNKQQSHLNVDVSVLVSVCMC